MHSWKSIQETSSKAKQKEQEEDQDGLIRNLIYSSLVFFYNIIYLKTSTLGLKDIQQVS